MPDVFISYNRDDREVAHAVASGLEAEGFSVWYDAALRAGEYYEEVTETNLRSAGAVVVLWSKRSTNSKWVRAEATVGERSSTLVPVLIEDCDRPVRFELLQTADLTRWQGDRKDPNWRSLVGDVRAAIARPSGAAAPSRSNAAAATSAVAPAQDNAANFETTFWNSINDSAESADFEAYLARYPHGHFADLARNRIAAMARAARPTPLRPQGGAAATVAQTVTRTAPPTPKPQPKAAPPPRPAVQVAAKAASKSGGGGAVLIAGAAAALAAAGIAGYFLLRSNSAGSADVATVKTAATEVAAVVETPIVAETTPEVAADPGEPPSEPATDLLGTFPLPTESEATREATPPPPTAQESPSPVAAATSRAPVEAPPAVVTAPKIATRPVAAAGTARDCEGCPLMAALSGGAFMMGSPEGEANRNPYEGPQHEVTVRPFRIGVFEVTAGEWGRCVADGVCAAKPAADEKLPALRISWNEAKAYTRWLSKKAGKDYRLPSESEWEYAARAGASTPWNWGDRFDAARLARTEAKAVGSFEPNAFGLHDMLSNAREWAEDCYNNNFTQTPRDGSAAKAGDCSVRVVRGGGFASAPADTRVANRIRNKPGDQIRYMGFRVAADE